MDEIEKASPEEIYQDPQNARKHPEENKALIRKSLEEIGPFRSIAVDGDGIIRAGNGVFEQAQEMGLKLRIVEAAPDELIAVKRPDLTGEKAIRAAILDNRTGELAEWDGEVLALLKESQPEVLEGMFDRDDWRRILAQLERGNGDIADTEPQIDKAEELRQKWGVELGQLWQIPSLASPGLSHRLLCGDSTSKAEVTRLMNGQKSVLFATDPPYLVDYSGNDRPYGSGKDWAEHYHDWDKAVDGDGLYDGFIGVAKGCAIEPDAAWYCWHASRNQVMLENIWKKHKVLVHQQIVWVKNRPTFTHSWYTWGHEPCFFGWLEGNKPRRVSTDILSSVWEIEIPHGDERVEHPTQKPIEVFTIPMLQHTAPGEICYEPFSGSGSQLAAAESVGRICYAMELSPAFVAVALERLAGMNLEPALVA